MTLALFSASGADLDIAVERFRAAAIDRHNEDRRDTFAFVLLGRTVERHRPELRGRGKRPGPDDQRDADAKGRLDPEAQLVRLDRGCAFGGKAGIGRRHRGDRQVGAQLLSFARIGHQGAKAHGSAFSRRQADPARRSEDQVFRRTQPPGGLGKVCAAAFGAGERNDFAAAQHDVIGQAHVDEDRRRSLIEDIYCGRPFRRREDHAPRRDVQVGRACVLRRGRSG